MKIKTGLILTVFLSVVFSCNGNGNGDKGDVSKRKENNTSITEKNKNNADKNNTEKDDEKNYKKMLTGKWEYVSTDTKVSGQVYKNKVFDKWIIIFKDNGDYSQIIKLPNSNKIGRSKPGLKWHIKGDYLYRSRNIKVKIYELTKHKLSISPTSSTRIIFHKID